jgi:hypothetical protein
MSQSLCRFHLDITLRLAFIRKICFWNLLENQKIFYGDDNVGDIYDVPKCNTRFPVLVKYANYFSFNKTNIIMMAGACGYGEELSSSINAENFLTSGKVYC